MPPLASARIIDLKTARLTLVRNADRVLPATLGAVPLTFRQWRGEIERQSPRLRWPAWIAAVAAHAIIGTAILLYATMTTLPAPLPVIAVTLSFETSKPTAEPVAPPVIEAAPIVPEPPLVAEPAPNETLAPAPEPPPPEPEAAAVEMPPPMPVPEPEPTVAPEPSKPMAVTPPPPTPSRRPARPIAPATPRQATPTKPATVQPTENPPAAAPSPPTAEQMAAIPIVPPRPVSAAAGNRKPDYPAAAQRRQLEGRVVLRINVSASGIAEAVAVAASSGHPVLDQAALDAVRTWRFNPATRGGVAVPGIVDVPIQFRFEE
jgi:periplasmic protein TonB